MARGPGRKPANTKASEKSAKTNGNGANLGFEAQLFLAADKLRKNLEPSDYKHVALGLIFLKYISIAFEARHAALLAEDPASAEDNCVRCRRTLLWREWVELMPWRLRQKRLRKTRSRLAPTAFDAPSLAQSVRLSGRASHVLRMLWPVWKLRIIHEPATGAFFAKDRSTRTRGGTSRLY
jgi:hypothetical protein